VEISTYCARRRADPKSPNLTFPFRVRKTFCISRAQINILKYPSRKHFCSLYIQKTQEQSLLIFYISFYLLPLTLLQKKKKKKLRTMLCLKEKERLYGPKAPASVAEEESELKNALISMLYSNH